MKTPNVAIITQSTDTGINRLIAKTCSYIVEEALEEIGFTDIRILDADSSFDFSKVTHIIMIVPEWNASFPFTFKQMIDNSGYPSAFKGKKILLIGTSETTFGNIMGLTHLEHILQWIGCDVSHKKVCIPNVSQWFTKEKIFIDENDRLHSTIKSFFTDER